MGDYTTLSVDEALKKAEADGFIATVIGSGSTVLSQIPTVSSQVAAGSNVVLYTEGNQPEKVTVPSFLGCAAYEANSVALQAGLNVSYSGAVSSGGVAVAQSIAEGAEVARGTVVSVTFAANTSDGNSD